MGESASSGGAEQVLLIAHATYRRAAERSLVEATRALEHAARHDLLTGLPNRTLVLERLDEILARPAGGSRAVGAIFLDLDRFTLVNDSFGHAVGDEVLRAVAARLRPAIRRGDTLARFGGDGFVVLCEGLLGEIEAIGLADRLCQEMATPLRWSGGELALSLSAGVAVATAPTASSDGLLRDADTALHRAKQLGRNRVVAFTESMRASSRHRLETEWSLRRALDEGGFVVHHQPLVEVQTGRVVGHEALVRWRHPERGLVPPDEFIPVAEDAGLIDRLGRWVLEEAVRQTQHVRQRGGSWADLYVAVNLSGHQLADPGLVDVVRSVLATSGLPPQALQLEITETVLMSDVAATVGVLQDLKDLGVRLAVDDFGTGYSSLSYLKRFPVDVLKIDRSFIDGLARDPEDRAIAEAVVRIAETLGLQTVAEGVETAEQHEHLQRLGCTHAQGRLYGAPAPLDGRAPPVLAVSTSRSVGPVAATSLPPGRSTGRTDVDDTVTGFLRSLLRIRSAHAAAEALQLAARSLGAAVVPAADAGPDAIPVDLALGEGPPLLATAELLSVTRMELERTLPRLAEDAQHAIDLLRHRDRVAAAALRDDLTGLSNRRALEAVLDRTGSGTLAILDIDHFKQVNDTFGHEAGDAVLATFGRALAAAAAAPVVACRSGGEEFVVVVPDASVADVCALIERVRSSWARTRPRPVTFSAGVAPIDGLGARRALRAADAALYAAKEGGRAHTRVATPEQAGSRG